MSDTEKQLRGSIAFNPTRCDKPELRQVAALEHIAHRMSDNTEHLAGMKVQMAEYLEKMEHRIEALEEKFPHLKRAV